MRHLSSARTACGLTLFCLFAFTLFLAPSAAADKPADDRGENLQPPEKALAEACAQLDDPNVRGRMDGLLRVLLIKCGREHELGQVRQEVADDVLGGSGPVSDVPVNDPSGDAGAASHTQNETALALNEMTGTICSGYNDSWHQLTNGDGFTGFSRSTDGGQTFTDQGPLGVTSGGDPAIVWRRMDNKFYFAALRSGSLGFWRSDDDCQSFVFVGNAHTGSQDDKELLAVDNNVASPNYGRIYMAWTDFSAGGRIFSTYTDDGGATWSTPVALSGVGISVQGAWPTVAPNGDYYVAWLRWNPFPSGPIDVEIARSTDGGDTFSLVTNPMTGEVNPRDSAATGNCGRPALNGNIRLLPSPQIVVGPDGVLHVVYSYDQDGFNTGDVADIFYRRSTDSGATWSAEVQLNDDATDNDQYFPSISVGASNVLVAAWYDRRLDPSNLMIDYYKSFSYDGGLTWEPNIRVSDVSTPVYLDPSLATCYHGDYDQQLQTATHVVVQWGDDRNVQDGHNDPDVFAERMAVSTDYLVVPDPRSLSICAPADALFDLDIPQFQGFSEQVTLAASNVPAGASESFSTNPVTPPGMSTMTVTNTGAVTPGTYDIDVAGNSSPSNIVQDTTVTLTIFDQNPGAPTLTAPTDGAGNQPLTPTFEWSASVQAATYTIEIADDAGFSNIVDSATGLTDPEYTPAGLSSNTVYYWRVRATNPCGDSVDSAVFMFTTEPLPGDCPLGVVAQEDFTEGFEAGAGMWTTGGIGDTWVLSGTRPNTGSFSFHGTDVPSVSDQYLISPAIVLPGIDAVPITLQFWNWQGLEDRAGGCWDGGVLEITTDGGSNWIRLDAELLTDPYDGPIGSGFMNPLTGEDAWCGDPQDWLESIVDLDAFVGETVQFRWRLATDSSVGREGWYIDDVTVQSCPIPPIFSDGFESGDTTMWDLTVP